jgi:hypothetical protein
LITPVVKFLRNDLKINAVKSALLAVPHLDLDMSSKPVNLFIYKRKPLLWRLKRLANHVVIIPLVFFVPRHSRIR